MTQMTRQTVFRKLAALYGRMQQDYQAAASLVGLSCQGCTRNCCVSHFQHHTYVEWAYLWQGLRQLPEAMQETIRRRAMAAVRDAEAALAAGLTPQVMCPLNMAQGDAGQATEGLCGLYAHRLMICRLHGVPNRLTRPDGRALSFPGCWRAQEITATLENVPVMDRTGHYRDLLALEQAFLGRRFGRMPKVDFTLAQMIVAGPPQLGA